MNEVNTYIEASFAKLEGQTRKLVVDAFEAGQQSQQAKIDELQARVDATEKWVNKEKFVPTETWLMKDIVFADDLLDILKGNKDENRKRIIRVRA